MKKLLSLLLGLSLLAPALTFAQTNTHQGGTGLVDVSAGSILFGSVFNIRLGTSSALQWNNSASRLSFTNGSSTNLTTSNTLDIGSLVRPTANDGAALGSTAFQFSDLFLAEGGVINWDNGDATLTQSGNTVTLRGADYVQGGGTSITLENAAANSNIYFFNNGATGANQAYLSDFSGTMPILLDGAVTMTTSASTTALVISNTGTGATKCLQVSGSGVVSAASAACATGGTPGGTSGQVQYNASGAFGGVATGTVAAGLGVSVTAGQAVIGSGLTVSLASSSIFTGTTGQNAYFSGTNALIGTSSLFTNTSSQILIGTTTAVGTNRILLQVGNGSGQAGIEINGGGTNVSDGALLLFGNAATAASNAVIGGIGSISAYFGSVLDTNFGVIANSALKFMTNGTNLTRGIVQTTGEWGFGTTSPYALLSIHQFANDNARSTLLSIASSTASATTTLFSVTRGGQAASCETVYGATANGANYASSTSMTLDFQAVCNQVLLQVGGAAFTVAVVNPKAGDTKRIIIQNPAAAAGAITWSGVKWFSGTAPVQTTTANTGDMYSCVTTQASSTAATSVKVECGQVTGTQ